MGYSFSGLGAGGIAAGVGIGALLAAINSLEQAYQRIVAITENVVTGLLKVGAAAAAAVTGFVAFGEQGAAAVQQNLLLVQGITGATGDQMTALNDKVVQLSETYGVSAKDISEASQLYVKAGGDVKGAIDGALESVAQLKTIAPQLGTEEATNAIVTVANNFKVSSQQAADAIVQLSKTSTFSFATIVQALRQIGPEAANLGIPLSDVIAALSLLSQRGLTGTQAGTQLRQMFIDLLSLVIKLP